ncbi:four helix bundle protein [Marinirhabdus gelatinilytica]|uniref:Four helix bundle protein n=1 Tax=Marinirhabdus gelatinilytica TaxID=1703343 RepID=A0A370QIW1_9FLAO|nr:four helix bundle protein [Marinirhabdus gelatinilytica]RDK88298.1 four helix bundle protein [Marinirhabdus gelatinilytica]
MRLYAFEKLRVWQHSRQLAVKIYKCTKGFPSEEKFGLTSQMRRCAVSISSNVAEGTGRHSSKDKARFTEIAYSSALELLNQSILANDLELLDASDYNEIRVSITDITAMLDGLYKSQRSGK